MLEIKKTPILILSAPRTGSTVLGAYISQLAGKELLYFMEPDDGGQVGMLKFKNMFNYTKKFILKCHYVNFHKYDLEITDYLLHNAYIIRIRRKDIVKQIASLYIAIHRNKGRHYLRWWHVYKKDELNVNYTVPIDIELLCTCIESIKNSNSMLDNASINFDLDLYYEDLPKIENVGYFITPQPSNYNLLLDTIRALI